MSGYSAIQDTEFAIDKVRARSRLNAILPTTQYPDEYVSGTLRRIVEGSDPFGWAAIKLLGLPKEWMAVWNEALVDEDLYDFLTRSLLFSYLDNNIYEGMNYTHCFETCVEFLAMLYPYYDAAKAYDNLTNPLVILALIDGTSESLITEWGTENLGRVIQLLHAGINTDMIMNLLDQDVDLSLASSLVASSHN
jgi:hypothetical protein